MATLQELERALVKADKAGDTDAARKLAAVIVKARQDPANLIPDTQVIFEAKPEPTLAEKAIGTAETVTSVGTAATGGVLGTVAGTLTGLAQSILDGSFGTPEATKMVEEKAAKFGQALTFEPKTESGKEQLGAIGEVLSVLPPVIPIMGAPGQIATSARMAALPAETAVRAAVPIIQQGAERVGQAAGRMGQTVRTGIGNLIGNEPAQQQRPAQAPRAPLSSGGVSLERQRAQEAEMAGLRLTEGEIKRDPQLLAWEREKAKTPEFQEPFVQRQQENNRAALSRLEQILDSTDAQTPDISNTGIKVVDTLMEGWRKEKQKTNQLYNKFRASQEAQLPVDTAPVVKFLNDQPQGVANITGVTDTARQNAIRLGIASTDADGKLVPAATTLGKLEEFRESINAISASSSNDKRLSSILKREIDAVGDPIGGNLTKIMRAQRRRQANKYENNAIVSRLLLDKKGMTDPMVPIEDVFQKTILSSRPSEITRIKRVLLSMRDNEGLQAWNELKGATVKHIIDNSVSGLDANNLKVVSSAKMNAVLKTLDKAGKLDLVLGKSAAEQVRNLSQVLEYIQTNPPLTSINNSGTARTIAGLIAESALMGVTTGISLPVFQGAKLIQQSIKNKKIKAKIQRALNYRPEQSQQSQL